MMPLALAISVWGVVTGVAIVNAGMTVPIALVLTLLVFAGSAQLATLPLLAVGAPLWVVWITAALVNLRFVIFSAASRSYFVRLPWQQRLLAGYLNGDLGFALLPASVRRRHRARHARAVRLLLRRRDGELGGVADGVHRRASCSVGSHPPGGAWSWLPSLALLGVLIPMANKLPAVAGMIVTGVLAVLTVGMPMKLGLFVSVIVGSAVAVAADAWRFAADAAPTPVQELQR